MEYIHRNGEGICAVFDNEETARTKLAEVIDFARTHGHPLQCEIRGGLAPLR
jgi:ATP-dependent Clp protease adapter protein ClpS